MKKILCALLVVLALSGIAVAGGQEYDIDVDAVTGEILKFKLDD